MSARGCNDNRDLGQESANLKYGQGKKKLKCIGLGQLPD